MLDHQKSIRNHIDFVGRHHRCSSHPIDFVPMHRCRFYWRLALCFCADHPFKGVVSTEAMCCLAGYLSGLGWAVPATWCSVVGDLPHQNWPQSIDLLCHLLRPVLIVFWLPSDDGRTVLRSCKFLCLAAPMCHKLFFAICTDQMQTPSLTLNWLRLHLWYLHWSNA